MNEREPLVSIDAIAAHVGVTTRTVNAWCDRGMPHYKGGGKKASVRFLVSEVEAWMRRAPDDKEAISA